MIITIYGWSTRHLWLPDPDECDESSFILPVADGERRDRVIVRMRTHVTRTIEFAMVQQTLDDNGDWQEVVRADTCHDEVHVHQFDKTGREISKRSVRKVERVEDVDAGYDEAAVLVFERWEDNVRRWNSGR